MYIFIFHLYRLLNSNYFDYIFIFDNKKVSTKNPNYIGVDLSNDLIVITNGNPYMKGLMDVHKCAYLPSGHNNSDIDSESSTIARVRRN